MLTLFLLFILWLPLSAVITSLVRATEGEFAHWYKKALYYLVTLPTLWLFMVGKLTDKYLVGGALRSVGIWFRG